MIWNYFFCFGKIILYLRKLLIIYLTIYHDCLSNIYLIVSRESLISLSIMLKGAFCNFLLIYNQGYACVICKLYLKWIYFELDKIKRNFILLLIILCFLLKLWILILFVFLINLSLQIIHLIILLYFVHIAKLLINQLRSSLVDQSSKEIDKSVQKYHHKN